MSPTIPKPSATDVGALQRAAVMLEQHLKAQSLAPAKLMGPATLTVKMRNGEFRHRAFTGKEEFLFNGVYAGKSGKLILSFRPTVPSEFSYVELNFADAGKHLTGWAMLLEDAMFKFDDNLQDQREQIAAIEATRGTPTVAETAENPLFGSW